jgi:hypothetical protein
MGQLLNITKSFKNTDELIEEVKEELGSKIEEILLEIYPKIKIKFSKRNFILMFQKGYIPRMIKLEGIDDAFIISVFEVKK